MVRFTALTDEAITTITGNTNTVTLKGTEPVTGRDVALAITAPNALDATATVTIDLPAAPPIVWPVWTLADAVWHRLSRIIEDDEKRHRSLVATGCEKELWASERMRYESSAPPRPYCIRCAELAPTRTFGQSLFD